MVSCKDEVLQTNNLNSETITKEVKTDIPKNNEIVNQKPQKTKRETINDKIKLLSNHVNKTVSLFDTSFSYDKDKKIIGVGQYEFPILRTVLSFDSGQYTNGKPLYLVYIRCDNDEKCVYDYSRKEYWVGNSIPFKTRYAVNDFIKIVNEIKDLEFEN